MSPLKHTCLSGIDVEAVLLGKSVCMYNVISNLDRCHEQKDEHVYESQMGRESYFSMEKAYKRTKLEEASGD